MRLSNPVAVVQPPTFFTDWHADENNTSAPAPECIQRPLPPFHCSRDEIFGCLGGRFLGSQPIAADLGEIFRSRQARKIYWAVVEGVPKPTHGRISLFLAKGAGMGDDRSARQPGQRRDPERMRIAKHGEEDAQHSLTYYAVVDKVAPRLAWVSMKPVTGRTHQLRAHAEAIGNPMIGDPKYHGNLAANDPRRSDPLRAVPAEVERKLHLVARRLVLPHPKGGTLDVTAPLPPHMKKTFDLFGFDVKQHDPIEDSPED